MEQETLQRLADTIVKAVQPEQIMLFGYHAQQAVEAGALGLEGMAAVSKIESMALLVERWVGE
jgi:hypothetical protein